MSLRNNYHPAFTAGLEIVLWQHLPKLIMEQEHLLNKEPLRTDLLVIKKEKDTEIQSDIARLFRMHNIIEYKSPDDALSIDQYYKALAYACLYKAYGKTTNAITAAEVTISIFWHRYPRKLFWQLKQEGATIINRFPGVYYIEKHGPILTQIIVMKELDPTQYSVFRVLAPEAKEDDIRRFIQESRRIESAGYRRDVDAVFQVSISKNKGLYERIRKEDTDMCEALRELMKEELLEEWKEGHMEGHRKGHQKGVKDGCNMTLDIMDRRRAFPEESLNATARAVGCSERDVKNVVNHKTRTWRE